MAVQHAPQRHEIRHRPECVGICISEMYFLRGSCIHSIAMLGECLDLLDEGLLPYSKCMSSASLRCSMRFARRLSTVV